MRTLSFLFWTSCSVALGIWMATVPIGGRTPWEHAKRVWAGSGISLPALPSLHALTASGSPDAPKITERHTDQEREAVNRLIARSASK